MRVSVSQKDLFFLKDYTDIMYSETEQALDRIAKVDKNLKSFIKRNFKKSMH